MKIRFLILFYLLSSSSIIISQVPLDVYKMPLNKVLSDIEKRYKIRLEYNENDIKGVEITYPTWRYRVNIEQTLNNILLPLDFVFQKESDSDYIINKFEYWHRTPAEGKHHLDQLLASYPALPAWEARKTELRKCFLEQLQLSPLPRKTALNPIYTNKRRFDSYTVENVYLANEAHDYGISKRLSMYDFMSRTLGLNINTVKDKSGKIDESGVTIEKYEAMLVFGKEGKLPPNAVKGPDAILEILKSLQ